MEQGAYPAKKLAQGSAPLANMIDSIEIREKISMKLSLSSTLFKQPWCRTVAHCSLIFALAACQDVRVGSATTQATVASEKIEAVNLAIAGYNYTDRYINDFSVNGLSGGNLYVSSPTGGGGGTTCCAVYVSGDRAWKIKVEWQIGGCTYDNSVNDDGSPVYSIHPYYKEVDVQVDPSISMNPKYLEVHFYPDGHVEAALTDTRSPPRLALDQNRENKRSRLVMCKDGRRPQN